MSHSITPLTFPLDPEALLTDLTAALHTAIISSAEDSLRSYLAESCKSQSSVQPALKPVLKSLLADIQPALITHLEASFPMLRSLITAPSALETGEMDNTTTETNDVEEEKQLDKEIAQARAEMKRLGLELRALEERKRDLGTCEGVLNELTDFSPVNGQKDVKELEDVVMSCVKVLKCDTKSLNIGQHHSLQVGEEEHAPWTCFVQNGYGVLDLEHDERQMEALEAVARFGEELSA